MLKGLKIVLVDTIERVDTISIILLVDDIYNVYQGISSTIFFTTSWTPKYLNHIGDLTFRRLWRLDTRISFINDSEMFIPIYLIPKKKTSHGDAQHPIHGGI